MTFVGRFEPLDGPPPAITFRWDPETEILSGALPAAGAPGGYTGAIELEDPRGAFITLDVQNGGLAAIEIVVWPDMEVTDRLLPPDEVPLARLVVPPRASQPGIALTEVELAIAGRRTADESVIHLRIGGARWFEALRLADKLIVEVDRAGMPAGFWLLGVPAFPAGDAR